MNPEAFVAFSLILTLGQFVQWNKIGVGQVLAQLVGTGCGYATLVNPLTGNAFFSEIQADGDRIDLKAFGFTRVWEAGIVPQAEALKRLLEVVSDPILQVGDYLQCIGDRGWIAGPYIVAATNPHKFVLVNLLSGSRYQDAEYVFDDTVRLSALVGRENVDEFAVIPQAEAAQMLAKAAAKA